MIMNETVITPENITDICNKVTAFLEKKMSEIENRVFCNSFDFKGYTFDFTNYNEESVAVVRQTIEKSVILYTRLLAC